MNRSRAVHYDTHNGMNFESMPNLFQLEQAVSKMIHHLHCPQNPRKIAVFNCIQMICIKPRVHQRQYRKCCIFQILELKDLRKLLCELKPNNKFNCLNKFFIMQKITEILAPFNTFCAYVCPNKKF